MIKALVIGAFVGLGLGTFVTVLVVVVSSIIAFVQDTRIDIPGVYTVWADDSAGSAGLAFLPNFAGITLMIACIALVCVGIAFFARSRAAAR